MLAASKPITPADIDLARKARYGVARKFDGIRNLQMKSISKSRKLIDIPNQNIQKTLGTPLLDGMDGELIVGLPEADNCIQATTSGVMRRHWGTTQFAYYVFDVWDSPGVGFVARLPPASGSYCPASGPAGHPRAADTLHHAGRTGRLP